MERSIKVVWICHFSNSKIRSHIQFDAFYFRRIAGFFLRHDYNIFNDRAVWVTNAIHEFEKFKDVDLTIIFPYYGIKGKVQTFDLNNIHYICYKSEDDNLFSCVKNKIIKKYNKKFYYNRLLIKHLISEISPDIVHVIGAENPYYSVSALDIPRTIPSIVSLQTLLADPDFLKNYPISVSEYNYRAAIEAEILKKCNYIASPVDRYKKIVTSSINPKAVFLDLTLALGQEINTDYSNIEYDFVYFSANLNKAGDYALEAFAILHNHRPSVTLNMSGSISKDLKEVYDKRIKELGIKDNVFFTGAQPTHDDVLRQIKKSRFAILPLKIDLISGTIREAMACGIPVVTTITPATPDLNNKRKSVLLSPKGDYDAMAKNMLKLLEDEELAEQIKQNGLKTVQELYSNESFMNRWRKSYYEVYDKFHHGFQISDDLML